MEAKVPTRNDLKTRLTRNGIAVAELTIDQALKQAIEAHKVGQVQDADRLYTAILKAQPKHPDANHNMGVLAVGVGKIDQALPFFKTALEANPAKAQFWISYIDALIKLGKLADAKAVLDQAKSKGAKGDGFDKLDERLKEANKEPQQAKQIASEPQPQQPNILDTLKLDQAISLAKKKEKAGSTEEAKRVYEDILTKFPKNKRAIDGLKGLVGTPVGKASKGQEPPHDKLQTLINLYNQGQLQQALEQAAVLTKQYPKAFSVWNLMGASAAQIGLLDQAIFAFKKVLAIKPKYIAGYNNIGIALKEQGKLKEAIEAYNKALAIKPDYTEAYNNMGIALKDQGKLEEAIEAYNKALAIKPDYTEAYNNMGIALKEQGKLEKAIEAYNKALAIKPDDADAFNNMGNALKDQSKLEEAIEAYNKALAIKPDDADTYSNMGVTLKKQGKLEEAIRAYNKALAFKPNNAEVHYNLGNALQGQGKLEKAIEAFNKALAIKPDNAEAFNNMGIALKDQGKLEEATNAYIKALTIKPDYADAFNNIGNALKDQGKLEEAIEAYNKALAIKPDYAEVWSNGAEGLEKWNKLKDLELWLKRAFQILDPVPSDISFIKSKLLWRNKDTQEAIKLIANIDFNTLTPVRRLDYLNLKAKCFDASQDYDAAFNYFKDMNSCVIKSNDYLSLDPDGYFQNIKGNLKSLKSNPLGINTIKSVGNSDLVPVFLVGFPRSGTTLLDTILRSHSSIDVVEEQSTVSSAEAFLQKAGYIAIEHAAPQDVLAGAKNAYISELDKHRQLLDSKPVLIDKLPLNLLHAPLIQQLYPQAKFILALRHPLDTILSCWMQNFKLNSAMANMVDLGRIVEFYCVAMETFKICRTRYNLNVHQIKYEDLLEDLSGETSALLKFLGLNWENQMANYQDTAFKRGRINTPSYSQVVQPIYKEAKYRWLHYEKHLRRYVMEVEPWISEYGYSKH